MQMCIGARFDGLCEVHYVCFKHRKAFRQGCNCTFCHDVRKQISMKRIGSLNCAILTDVDGGYHKNQTEKDKRRDAAFFKVRGFRTVRITNEDVFSGRFKVILVSEGVLKSSSSV